MKLDKIVPFGRSRDEYEKMFSLTEADLTKRILGVGDGPACFNAEMTAAGYSVISIDPIYAFGLETIRRRFEAVLEDIISQVQASKARWAWSYHRSPEQLRENRILAFQRFAADYYEFQKGGTQMLQISKKKALP